MRLSRLFLPFLALGLAGLFAIAGSTEFADAAGTCGAGPRRIICLNGGRATVIVPPIGAAAAANDGALYPAFTAISPVQYDSATKLGWLAYQSTDGANLVVHIAVYNNSSTPYVVSNETIPARSWSQVYEVGLQTATTFLVTDHGAPSVCQDAGGYWHVFYGTWFSNPLQHAVTTNPNDWTSWTQLANIGNGTTEGPGYPNCVMVGSTMYLFYQNALTGQTGPELWLRTSSSIVNGVVTFNAPITIGTVTAGNEWFPGGYALVGTDIWFPVTRSIVATPTPRDNVYLLRYDTVTGNVKNVDASFSTAAASLPVSAASLISNYAVTIPGAGNGGIIATLAFDSNSIPNILYAFGANPTQYYNTFAMRATQFVSGAWQAPVNLGSNTGAAFNSATIIQDTDGGVTAYWTQINSTLQGLGNKGGGDIATAHKPLGGAWGAASVLQVAGQTTGPFGNPTGPYALDGGGRVVNGPPEMQVFWYETDDAGGAPSGQPFGGHFNIFAYGSTGYLKASRPVYQTSLTSGAIAKFVPKVTAARGKLIDAVLACEQAASLTANYQAMWVFANSTAQAASVSWIPPTVLTISTLQNNVLTLSGAPTFTADRGYQGNGTSDYIDTGLTPANGTMKWSQNNATASAYTLSATSNNAAMIGSGVSGAVNELLLAYTATTTGFARVNSTFVAGGSASGTVAGQTGLLSGSRTSSILLTLYANGLSIGTAVTASTGVPNTSISLLAARSSSAFSNILMAEADLGLGQNSSAALAHFSCLHPYMQAVAGAP